MPARAQASTRRAAKKAAGPRSATLFHKHKSLKIKPWVAGCPAYAACGRAGKYTPGGTKAAGPRSAMFSDERLTQVAPLLGLMRDVGSAHGGKTCAQVAINWTICKGALPIPGPRAPVSCCAARTPEGKSLVASRVRAYHDGKPWWCTSHWSTCAQCVVS